MTEHEASQTLLSSLSTFRMGGPADTIVHIQSEDDLSRFFENRQQRSWLVLGGGSNVVFPDEGLSQTLLKIEIQGIEEKENSADGVALVVGAGVLWDSVVAYAVDRGYSGIEALSAIPGTAGATPIQNVGAYGTEIKDVLVSARVFDTHEKVFKTLTNAECAFAYRDSVFKHEGKGRYIVTQITLRLSKQEPSIPNYAGVKEYLLAKGIEKPSLMQIREAITEIRWKKLTDPKDIASC